MGAHMAVRPARPWMVFAILASVLAAGLPAAAHHHSQSKDKHQPQGVVVWFNSVLSANGLPAGQPVSLCVSNQVISWREGSRAVSITVPDAIVAFKPWETFAHTYFGLGHWDTSAPLAQAASDTFMSGVELPLPGGVPKNARNFTWTAQFTTNTPGISVQWQWGMASYTRFSDDYNALGVAISDIVSGTGKHRIVDLAGTPVAFKDFVYDPDDDDDEDDAGSVYTGDRSDPINAVPVVTGICAGGPVS